MSRYVVVDSSVAVEWFLAGDEHHHARAFDLLSRHRAEEIALAAPSLMRLEVLNTFWKRDATSDDLAAISSVLEGFSLEWFDLTAGLTSDAGTIAAQHGLTVYDATFAALALHLDATLVTQDRRILRSKACRAQGLEDVISSRKHAS